MKPKESRENRLSLEESLLVSTRMQHSMKNLSDTSKLKKIRKNIARIHTENKSGEINGGK